MTALPVRIMEVCGTHTHEIFRLGIRKLLPKQVELISGPGCPVCVTPVSYIDEAVYLALEKQCDNLYIRRSWCVCREAKKSLCRCKKQKAGRSRSSIHRPMRKNMRKNIRKKQVVFLSVGFETTTPAGCLSVEKSKRRRTSRTIPCLMANKTMPQAYRSIKRKRRRVSYIRDMSMRSQEQSFVKHLAAGRCQRCGGRLYGERTADGTGCCTGTFSGRETVLCKLLSACSNRSEGSKEAQTTGG